MILTEGSGREAVRNRARQDRRPVEDEPRTPAQPARPAKSIDGPAPCCGLADATFRIGRASTDCSAIRSGCENGDACAYERGRTNTLALSHSNVGMSCLIHLRSS